MYEIYEHRELFIETIYLYYLYLCNSRLPDNKQLVMVSLKYLFRYKRIYIVKQQK